MLLKKDKSLKAEEVDGMIKVSPVQSKEQIDEIFNQFDFAAGESSAVLIATDACAVLGKCLLECREDGVHILAIDFQQQDDSLVDWLMRAAMNYAANRGAYLAFCKLPQFEDILLSLSFEKKGDAYIGEVPEIFKGCKKCGCNG